MLIWETLEVMGQNTPSLPEAPLTLFEYLALRHLTLPNPDLFRVQLEHQPRSQFLHGRYLPISCKSAT
jgi:hypothetical protein